MGRPVKKTIKLAKIRTDGGTQARAGLNKDVIAEYAAAMAEGRQLPPVELVVDKKGNHWLVDGFHRVYAAKEAKLKEIEAWVEEGTQEDAQWKALAANKNHGLRRSNEDKAKAVRAALRARPQLSDVVISDHVGVDAKTVAKHRAELEAGSEIPTLTVRKGADGKDYEIKKPAKSPPRVSTAEAQDIPPDDVPARNLGDGFEGDALEEAFDDAPPAEADDGSGLAEAEDEAPIEEAPPAPAPAVASPPAKKPALADDQGRPVPDHLAFQWTMLVAEASAVRADLERAGQRFSKLQDAIAKNVRAQGSQIGWPVALANSVERLFEVGGAVAAAVTTLKKMVPHVVCEDCGGDGCHRCGQLGWFSKKGLADRQRVDGILDDAGATVHRS